MSEINSDCIGTIGEIANTIHSMTSVEWKIPNYFSLPQEVDYKLHSSSFTFLDATWHLRLYPNGESEESTKGIGLYVVKQHSSTSSHYVHYTLGIRKNDGSVYKVTRDEGAFVGYEGLGRPKLAQRGDILRNKTEIAPQDTLTFFCMLHAKKTNEAEKVTQTTLYENLDQVSENFKELLINEEGSDTVIKVKDKKFRVHKTILTARSSVFKSMFEDHMKKGTNDIMDISHCDPITFRDFLHYVYCGKIGDFSVEKALDLYFMADKYRIEQLKMKCVASMMNNVSVDNFSEMIALALKYNETELLQKTTSFFIANATEIIVTVKWLTFLKENPIEANELYLKTLKAFKQ